MGNFDKRMALGEIEDALTNMDTPHGRGLATGLCGAFYMCGLLSADEWEAFMGRIPAEPNKARSFMSRGASKPKTRIRSQFLN